MLSFFVFANPLFSYIVTDMLDSLLGCELQNTKITVMQECKILINKPYVFGTDDILKAIIESDYVILVNYFLDENNYNYVKEKSNKNNKNVIEINKDILFDNYKLHNSHSTECNNNKWPTISLLSLSDNYFSFKTEITINKILLNHSVSFIQRYSPFLDTILRGLCNVLFIDNYYSFFDINKPHVNVEFLYASSIDELMLIEIYLKQINSDVVLLQITQDSLFFFADLINRNIDLIKYNKVIVSPVIKYNNSISLTNNTIEISPPFYNLLCNDLYTNLEGIVIQAISLPEGYHIL